MDYHSIHGHDVASFEISSSHRLPTVTASAALEELKEDKFVSVSTGIHELDKHLQNGVAIPSQNSAPGGVKRGQVTEIWGPPGTGKTALGLQMTANARHNGHGVVWIDCFQDVSTERVAHICEAIKHEQSQSPEDGSEKDGKPGSLYHYACLTLPHLIALISRPTPRIVPKDTSLIILDSATALINSTLPRPQGPQNGKFGPDMKRGPNPSVKRRQALQSIMKSLQTLASTKNCAVVLISQCATKMHSEGGATLTPAINTNLWEQGVSTRLVLFRDWDWVKGKQRPLYLAGVQKLDGKSTNDAIELVSAFKIGQDGISSVPYDAARHTLADAANVTQPKRKLAQTDFEVPDSEDDEDYGWAEDDESAMPPPPPQWQGSEDILLGQEVGHSSDDDDEGEEDEDEHESAEE